MVFAYHARGPEFNPQLCQNQTKPKNTTETKAGIIFTMNLTHAMKTVALYGDGPLGGFVRLGHLLSSFYRILPLSRNLARTA